MKRLVFAAFAILALSGLAGYGAPATAQTYKYNFSAQAWSVDPKYKRMEIDFKSDEKPGTIIIHTSSKYLYLIEENGKAMRYGIGVGRDGFRWTGVEYVTRKAEWPDWTPPAEMRERDPTVPVFMKGGPDNPLGARAMYLGASIYRIHGTAQPWTIGMNLSSGCIRLQNDDVTDLYNRVKIGAKVIVQE